MEQQFSSSKVTVEYFDPAGVFPLLSQELLSRLPLRNLHWESPTRSVRSIDSLHVDLVPYNAQPTEPPSLTRLKSSDSNASPTDVEQKTQPDAGSGTFKGSIKERRHQIPGLRQTPYLKVYFVQCDDNETYKATVRKSLREWIKGQNPPVQSTTSLNTQENHDAYEWLIVHVVLPQTSAASQPRTSGNNVSKDGNGPEKATSGPRWPGRGSSTLFEKIRSDFNGSSKSAIDRVAQIRVQRNLNSHNSQREPSTSESYPESEQDHNFAWHDLITKFKSLILTSFDLRVGQYEEDIRERDAQRSLPGWNFCTFFVLKEGLARGFESVGLVKDALVGYDELSIGLDLIISGRGSGNSRQAPGNTLLEYTEELRRHLEHYRIAAEEYRLKVESDEPNQAETAVDVSILERRIPDSTGRALSATNKRYRDLILSNNISTFDFRCYIFARQLALLLRLANALSSRSELMNKVQPSPTSSTNDKTSHPHSRSTSNASDGSEDLLILAEICRRAIEFITSTARILRKDLWNGYSRSQKVDASLPPQEGDPKDSTPGEISQIIDNMVSAWMFSLTQQILTQTYSQSLSLPPSYIQERKYPSDGKFAISRPDGHEPKVAIPEPKTIMHPARISSLSLRPVSVAQPSSSNINDTKSSGLSTAPAQPILKTGLEELSAYCAELFILSRAALEAVGKQHLGLTNSLHPSNSNSYISEDMEDINLDNTASSIQFTKGRGGIGKDKIFTSFGVADETLIAAVSGKEEFSKLYEVCIKDLRTNVQLLIVTIDRHLPIKLYDTILKHLDYMTCNRSKCVISQLGDIATAASYYSRMVPFYAESNWSSIETSMLRMYARCVKKLERKDEYIHTLLKLLEKAAASKAGRLINENLASLRSYGWFGGDNQDIQDCVSDLLATSAEMPHETTVPMANYFGDLEVEPYPRHFPNKDGFQLLLKVLHLLPSDLKIQNIKVRIVSTFPGHSREIWLENEEVQTLKPGVMRIWVGTNASIPGVFMVDKILFETHNLVFVQENDAKTGATTPINLSEPLSTSINTPRKFQNITYYLGPNSLDARLSLPHFIHLQKAKSIEILITSGWNNISKGDMRIRSASAGLRIRIAEAQLLDGDIRNMDQSRPGIISFRKFPQRSSMRFRIPYELEEDLGEISVGLNFQIVNEYSNGIKIKLEVAYTTEKGAFLYASNPSISVALPLSVNVQDIFKKIALISRFTISTATVVPLWVISSSLEASESFEVQCGMNITSPMKLVVPKQPASLIYKIFRRDDTESGQKTPQKPLALSIEYRCLDEDVTDAVENEFFSAVKGTPAEEYSRLLLPTILSRVRNRVSAYDLESVGILGEIELGSFKEMKWDEALNALDGNAREKVAKWLMEWHVKYALIQLDRDPIYLESKSRKLVIPVEVPLVQVVHTAELLVYGPGGGIFQSGAMTGVGEVLRAELHIHKSRTWKPRVVGNDEDSDPEFCYEFLTNPDLWLIGGQRRAHFRIAEGEEVVFPITLLPLKTGHLLLPAVEIRVAATAKARAEGGDVPASRPGSATAQGREGQPSSLAVPSRRGPIHHLPESEWHTEPTGPIPAPPPTILCETDYVNQGQTVLVLPNVSSTTISLDPGAPGGGAWLLESERRHEELSIG
ncbi:MAG: hypothetical protein M1829_003722 [Trizodia sp. TS-e1964]|nr:MAG: hypothetical protein M1829_003722 [Trizodia sp. TS-e1964]